MKKMLLAILAILLIALLSISFAEDKPWYALIDDECTLEVNLEADESSGYKWMYIVEEPSILICESSEYLPAQKTDNAMPNIWKAKFGGGKNSGNTILKLEYTSPLGEVVKGYTINLGVIENYVMYIDSVGEYWHFLDKDQKILTVSLEANSTTGYEWKYKISNDKALEVISSEYVENQKDGKSVGVGGKWIASFRALAGFEGEAEIKFSYSRNWESEAAQTHKLKLVVNKEGIIGSVKEAPKP